MKIAFFSDLHANQEATLAVLEHAQTQGVELKVFLGDLVGYGADPGWVVDLVRREVAQGAYAVKGNHDAAAVNGPSPTMRPDARAALIWTQERLTDEQREFLSLLPFTQQRGDQLYVHANALEPGRWGYVQGRSEAVQSMHATECRYTFCGHVHEQQLYNLAGTGKIGDFTPTPGMPIPVPPHRQWLAIVGSSGQPRDGNPAACYAVFDEAQCLLTFHRVPYDHDTAAAKIRATDLPWRLADRLATGD